jgi:hypothetical protein
MTLSYRWGSLTSLKLREDNIDLLQEGLHISRLPRTFQDAILVTRRFSIQYLWIDALCIIQDSDSDWKREAPTMRYVYSHSACNIAASAAINQDSGFFRTRCESNILPAVVSYYSSQNSGPKQHYLLFEWNRHLARGPLQERGWIFQECLLAPRVLYFTENQVLYECFQETKSEGFPQGIPYHRRPKDLGSLWDLLDDHASKSVSKKPERMSFRVHELWNHILERYSRCNFTFSKDRLPALLGIAQLFAQVTGDEYIDGLWRSHLIEQLVWRVPQPQSQSIVERGISSWSWASTDEEVKPVILSEDWRNLIVINGIERRDASEISSTTAEWSSLRLAGVLSVLGEEKSLEYLYNHMGVKTLNAKLSQDNLGFDLDKLEEIFFLPVLTFHPWYPPRKAATCVVGLILAAVHHAGSAVFKRVAQFTTESMEDVERLGFSMDEKGLARSRIDERHSELIII